MKYYAKSNTYSFTDEEKKEASNISVISFCEQNYGLHFKKSGSGYRCQEHNSLYINSNEKLWYWNSRGYGGGDVVAFVQKYANLSFSDALVAILKPNSTNISVTPYTKAPEQNNIPKKYELELPPKKNGKYNHAFAYLCYTRGIDSTIITTLIHKHYIYEDTHKNIVFVGYDENGIPKYGSIKGTNSQVQYRGEAPGSDKDDCGGFSLKGYDKSIVRVFEAPIDLLSDCTIENIKNNSNRAWLNVCRVSLGGTCANALDSFLKKNPEIKEIHFMLDNDDAGQKATNKFMNLYKEQGYDVYDDSPKLYKDVNAMLLAEYSNRTKKAI